MHEIIQGRKSFYIGDKAALLHSYLDERFPDQGTELALLEKLVDYG